MTGDATPQAEDHRTYRTLRTPYRERAALGLLAMGCISLHLESPAGRRRRA